MWRKRQMQAVRKREGLDILDDKHAPAIGLCRIYMRTPSYSMKYTYILIQNTKVFPSAPPILICPTCSHSNTISPRWLWTFSGSHRQFLWVSSWQSAFPDAARPPSLCPLLSIPDLIPSHWFYLQRAHWW